MNLSYDELNKLPNKKIKSGFIYTMNVTEEQMNMLHYQTTFEHIRENLKVLGGSSEYIVSNNTYQFSDYSKYEASIFDVKEKERYRNEVFPIDCQKAYDMGRSIC